MADISLWNSGVTCMAKSMQTAFFPGLLNPAFLIIDTGVSRCVASRWARL